MITRSQVLSVFVHMLLLAASAIMLMPFIWMVSASLKSPPEIIQPVFELWPRNWHAVANYARAFEKAPLVRVILNGMIVCGSIVVLQIAIAAPCAYALAKFDFRGRGLLFAVVLSAIAIPVQVSAVPLFLGLNAVGLLDSYVALVVPFLASGFGIFLFRQFFKSYPDDILNSARLDGLSELSILCRIVLPSAWPAAGAFSIFSFVAHWNDLYWPLVVIMNPDLATPPLGLLFLKSAEGGSDYGALMAAATVVTAPLIAAFLLAQRQFIQGLTMTGIK